MEANLRSLNPYAGVFGVTALRDGLNGDADFLAWLKQRVRSQAAPRFSAWAWEWIEDDFFMDLITQLKVTVAKPGFTLQ